MGKYKAPTPKRTIGWSNDKEFIQQLISRGGFLTPTERSRLTAELVGRKRNAAGVLTFTGKAKVLQQSQLLGLPHKCLLRSPTGKCIGLRLGVLSS